MQKKSVRIRKSPAPTISLPMVSTMVEFFTRERLLMSTKRRRISMLELLMWIMMTLSKTRRKWRRKSMDLRTMMKTIENESQKYKMLSLY